MSPRKMILMSLLTMLFLASWPSVRAAHAEAGADLVLHAFSLVEGEALSVALPADGTCPLEATASETWRFELEVSQDLRGDIEAALAADAAAAVVIPFQVHFYAGAGGSAQVIFTSTIGPHIDGLGPVRVDTNTTQVTASGAYQLGDAYPVDLQDLAQVKTGDILAVEVAVEATVRSQACDPDGQGPVLSVTKPVDKATPGLALFDKDRQWDDLLGDN